ncbi:MAG: hypothetical protein ACRDRN_03600 [Sciscionella sp.]
MASTLPVPIEFSLPEGWRSAPPDEVGAGEAAFVALHPASSQGFTANITISGEVRTDGAPLTQVADEALGRLQRNIGEVRLGERKQAGSSENPGLTQAVKMTIEMKGQTQDLVQLQVFLSMADVRDKNRSAVLQFVLTATPQQFQRVAGDFQQFVSTVRPEQGENR